MTRFLEASKAPFALEGSEMLARRKRVRERGTWSVLELDSRPERVLEQGSPKSQVDQQSQGFLSTTHSIPRVRF